LLVPALAIAALVCALAWPMQGRTLGELSNYALVKALADGTPTIDRTRFEVGDVVAGDFRTIRGHVYSDKAPGLAFVTLPAYIALRTFGMRTSGDPTRALWALRLWGAVIPAALLLLITRALSEQLAPGYGTATAITLGAGTLILPLTTMFYSHVLTALLLLASFALLWWERAQAPRHLALVAAGFLVGFAITTEYPSALAAGVFGLYVLARRPWISRGLAYSAGVALGVVPLLAYNRWAFGSFTHLSYFGDELTSGNLAGRLDPSLINALFTFASMPGLVVLTPVLACAFLATALMYWAGMQAEALAIAGVFAAFTIYNASLPGVEYDAFTAGPRYLIPVLPLLALPLALTYRRWPLTTSSLALVSMILMAAMTGSHVHSGVDPHWFDEIVDRAFPTTAASLVGVTGWYAIAPFFVAIAAAGTFAAIAARGSAPRWDPLVAGLAVVAWAGVALFAPNTLDGDAATYSAYLPVAVVLCAFASILGASKLAAARI
jgi:hypothetical protein